MKLSKVIVIKAITGARSMRVRSCTTVRMKKFVVTVIVQVVGLTTAPKTNLPSPVVAADVAIVDRRNVSVSTMLTEKEADQAHRNDCTNNVVTGAETQTFPEHPVVI